MPSVCDCENFISIRTYATADIDIDSRIHDSRHITNFYSLVL